MLACIMASVLILNQEILIFSLVHVEWSPRGWDGDNRLLQLETKWIFQLGAMKFPGIN